MSDDPDRNDPYREDHLIFGEAGEQPVADSVEAAESAPSAYQTNPAPHDEPGRADDGGYPRPPAFGDAASAPSAPPWGGGWDRGWQEQPSYEQPNYEQPAGSASPQFEQPQPEAPRWEQPQYEQPEYGRLSYDQAPSEQPQPEAPRWEQPQYEAPQFEQPQYEAPRYDQPKYEQSQYEQPRYDQPQYEQSQYEQSQYEQPSYDQPQYVQPSYDQPQYEQPTFAGQHPLDTSRPTPDATPAQARPEPEAPSGVAATMQRRNLPGPDSVGGHRAPTRRQPASNQPAPSPQPTHARPPGPQQWSAPGQPTPPPRPEDLLVPTRSDVNAAPASWGWRGRVNRGSGGVFKPKASPQEVAAREAIVRIQRSFSRPMTVVVVQPKGGAGKTPTTICLSAAFGAHRGGYVVGWDDNETRGTLQVRVRNPDNQQATVWDLLSDLDSFERQDARVGDLSYYVRAQPDAHFDALVSDDNPGNMAQIGDDEFQRLHNVLQRFYRMIVVDTGNNVRSANWQAAVNAADLVVVVSTYQRDVGFSASWVLDHLAQTGREELARNAVTVLTAADPTSDKQVRQELLNHFSKRTRAVVEIPYDAELAHGGPIGWANLQPATRNAWVEAGATVADALAEHEAKVLQARRS